MNDFSKKRSVSLDEIDKYNEDTEVIEKDSQILDLDQVKSEDNDYSKDIVSNVSSDDRSNLTIRDLSNHIPDMSNEATDKIMFALFKILYIMRLYNGKYDEFVSEQGEHPVLHKIWDLQMKLNQDLDEIVDNAVSIDGLDKLKEMDEKDLDAYRSKADYSKSEEQINLALNRCADVTTDYLIVMFTTFRNRMMGGSDILDTTLMSEEISYIGFQHQIYFAIYPHTDAIKNLATLLIGSDLFYDDLAYEHKIRYEIDKFDACNTYGISPNSYDEYIKAVQEYIETKLNTDQDIVITKFDDIDPIAEEAKEKCRHILKRVPNFEEDFKSKGRLVYKSMFLIRYIEIEEKMQAEFDKISPALGKGKGSASEVYNSMLKYREGVMKRRLEGKTKKEEAKETATKVRTKKSDVNDFLAKRRALKEKEKTSQNAQEQASDGELPIKTQEDQSRGIQEQNKGISKEVSEPEIVSETDKLLEILKNPVEETVDKTPDIKEEAPKTQVVTPIIKEDVETTKVIPTNKIVERITPLYDFNDLSTLEYIEPDKAILKDKRTYPEFSRRRKAYLDTGKYSRSIFLINSNYNVTVNKLKDGAKLDYMINLIKDMVDADANYMIKFELIRTVFESLTFDFDVSFQDFLKNTHESDLTVLFLMFALVNAPESYKKDGEIEIEIPNVYCKKCNTIAYFKTPIKIQLKSELTRLYSKELYLERYPRYQMAGYKSLLEAYRKSEVGKLKMIKGIDSYGFNYNIVFSYPTLYKSMEVDKMEDSISFGLLFDEMDNKLNEKATATDVDIEMYNYINGKTFIEIVDRYRELSKIDFDTEDIITKEMPEFKAMHKEYGLVISILTACDLIKSKMYYLFKIMKFVDLIEVTDEDGTTLDKLSHESSMMELIKALSNIDDNSTKELMDAVTSGLASDIKNQDIEFYPEDLQGLLEWDRYYLSDSKGNLLTEEEYEKYILENDFDDNIDIDTRREVRKSMKDNLDHGMCTCGNSPLVVNYTSLLFFSLSKI